MKAYIYNVKSQIVAATIEGESNSEINKIAQDLFDWDSYGMTYTPAFGANDGPHEPEMSEPDHNGISWAKTWDKTARRDKAQAWLTVLAKKVGEEFADGELYSLDTDEEGLILSLTQCEFETLLANFKDLNDWIEYESNRRELRDEENKRLDEEYKKDFGGF